MNVFADFIETKIVETKRQLRQLRTEIAALQAKIPVATLLVSAQQNLPLVGLYS